MKSFLCSVGLLSVLLLACQEEKKTAIHDIVIIGGGLMGSSTAWHLSKEGQSLLLLEKQDSSYTEGSSQGEARIARSNNRGNDIWSYLHNRSVLETEELIAFLNSRNKDQPYRMEDLYTTSPVTYVGRVGIYDKLLASLKRQKVDYDMAISPEEGRQKFGVNLPDSVLIQREFNQHSGTLNPQQLIRYLHRAVRQKGNDIRYRSRVTSLKKDLQSGMYEIQMVNEETGQAERLLTRKIVSAAGPYTGQLLKDLAPYVDRLIHPQRVFLAFFSIQKDVYESLSEDNKTKLKKYYPVINSSKGTRDGSFFSMIEYYDEDQHPVIKIGGHFQRSPIENLDEVWKKELSLKEIEWSRNSTADYFKLLDLPIEKDNLTLVKGYSCVYSLTHSEVPLVSPLVNEDNSPNYDAILLGGMSGVGAKGAMTYGLMAADLMNQRSSSDSMYLVTAKVLGFERLLEDISEGILVE